MLNDLHMIINSQLVNVERVLINNEIMFYYSLFINHYSL